MYHFFLRQPWYAYKINYSSKIVPLIATLLTNFKGSKECVFMLLALYWNNVKWTLSHYKNTKNYTSNCF